MKLIIIFLLIILIFSMYKLNSINNQNLLKFIPDKATVSRIEIVPVHNEKYAFSYTDKEKVFNFMSQLEVLKFRNDDERDVRAGFGSLIRFFDKDDKKIDEWVWLGYSVVNSTGQRLKVLEKTDHLVDDFILSNTPDILEEIPYTKHG